MSIEVSEELEALLKNEDRLEYNNDHANTRRHVPLETGKDGGAVCLTVEDAGLLALFIGEPDEERLRRVIRQLTPKQQKLLHALFEEGISVSSYARQSGVSQPAISQQLSTIQKKLKEIF